MDRTENLTPWPKGVSGNPGGRPKEKPISEAYKTRLAERLPPALRRVRINRQWIELDAEATFLDLISLTQCIEAGGCVARTRDRDCYA